ncbi:MAG: hypothetical protein C0418_03860 [Coriobacteriaceae bacterium]|nr:hypothetical protein [Coriobacteriaceae bacterium]
MPSGYRSSRRGSKVQKRARKAVVTHRVRERVASAWDAVRRYAWVAGRFLLIGAAVAAGAVLVVMLVAGGVNGAARWWAERRAAQAETPAGRAEKARDNLLVIASDEGAATAFLALKVDQKARRVWGLAIPDAVFVEVPGQGFERVGDSFEDGPDTSMSAISNFLSVPFEQFIVVDDAVYKKALADQSVAGLIVNANDTNLDGGAAQRLAEVMDSAGAERIGLIVLPIKPISIGEERFFEPNWEEIDPLLETWWGIRPGAKEQAIKVVVYNGSGSPGIAGTAAKELIRDGMRVVDTRNADKFTYKETLVLVQNGKMEDGEAVARSLGIGKVVRQDADQQVADVIVIIGKDFAAASTDG